MEDDLQFLVHFFNDKAYLFKTITMAGDAQIEDICNTISSKKGWYWPRFAPSERRDYMERRRFVEAHLYNDYAQEYGRLKERVPVYFYLVPQITRERAVELGKQRAGSGETEPHILMVKIADIADTSNITFTLNDSHTAYWKRTADAGIPCRGDGDTRVVLPDHNRVFPFSMIEDIHQRYQAQNITYEVQVWDYQLLEKLPFTILEDA